MTNPFKRPEGVLGINERNLRYIKPFNPPSAKRIADDKLLTKKVLIKNGIATPELIGEIKNQKQLRKFDFSKLPGSVVVKPKKGFGGEGIIVFFSKDRNSEWVKADKTRYDDRDLRTHISGILEGNFSLKNEPDTAFFEERVLMHPDFKKYSYRGIPDIRIIVFNKVPVMAMLRLPTKESDGKANLHAGGIGLGIDIAQGVTTTAVHHDKHIDLHPDSGLNLRGIRIPYWKKILEIAVQTQIHTGLGFLGVDLVIDRVKGPMVLELNARPGLAIQIANSDGLKARLERVAGLKINSVEHGIDVAKNLFGGEVEEEIEQVSGRQMVGYIEHIKIFSPNGEEKMIKVRNDTGARWSSIDETLMREMGYSDILDQFKSFKEHNPFSNLKEGRKVKLIAQRTFEEHPEIANIILIQQSAGYDLRPVFRLSFEMSGIKQEAKFSVTSRSHMFYDAIIGRKALRKFLIDPSRIYLGEK